MRAAALLALTAALAGCDAGRPCQPGGGNNAHGAFSRYVISRWVLPMRHDDYSIDLDCDGHADNQFGVALSSISSFWSIDNQADSDGTVRSGQGLVLLVTQTEQASETAWSDDPQAAVTAYQAKYAPFPDLTGGGKFVVDGTDQPTTVYGGITNGTFYSNAPGSRPPAALTLRVQFANAINLVPLPLQGVQVQMHAETAPSGAPGGNGVIRGAIRVDDFLAQAGVLLADSLTPAIMDNPNADFAVAVDRGCTGARAGDGKAGDRVLSPCELVESTALFAPDVQLFDDGGGYAPETATTRNAISVAIAFTAVHAEF